MRNSETYETPVANTSATTLAIAPCEDGIKYLGGINNKKLDEMTFAKLEISIAASTLLAPSTPTGKKPQLLCPSSFFLLLYQLYRGVF